MKRRTTGRMGKVASRIASEISQVPSSLPRNSKCHSSRQPDMDAPEMPYRKVGNLTGFGPGRLFVGLGLVHPELLQLAGEGVASPAEQARRILAVTLRVLERHADQRPLELRQR